jgi:PAS domain S-box-containing protein
MFDNAMTKKQLKTLIIDDDQEHSAVISAAISQAFPGAIVYEAQNGKEGLRLAQEKDPDIILLDIVMPEMDGFDTCRKLKANSRVAHIPVVFITAVGTDNENRVKALEVGGEGFLIKPLEKTELIAQIRAMKKIKDANAVRLSEIGELKSLAAQQTQKIERELAERKVVEKALRESEIRYRTFIDANSDMVFLKDESFRYLLSNLANSAFLGKSETEIVGHTDFDLMPGNSAKFCRASDQNVLTSMRTVVSEETAGQNIYQTVKFPVSLPGGGVGIGGYIRDITTLRNSEQKWRESEKRLREVAEKSRTFIWEVDAEGLYTYVNNVVEALFGYKPEEIIGRKYFYDLHPESGRDTFKKAVFEVFASRGTFENLENPIQSRSGQIVWVSTSGTPVYNDAGAFRGYCGMNIDVTKRILAEEAARHKAAILEAQMNSSIDGIIVVDSQGKKILQNQRTVNLWKIPQQVADNPDDAQQVRHVMYMTRNPEQFVEKIKYLYSHPDEITQDEVALIDGTILDRYSAPVFGKDGSNYGRIWMFRDITERKRLEAEREEMNDKYLQSQKMEAVGVLAGGVAHDFNNILTAIKAYAGFIYKDLLPEDPMRSDAEQILAASDRAAALTRQLLAFSRKQILAPQVVDLNKIVRDMTKMLKRLLREDIELVTKLTSAPCAVLVDPGQLEQVIMNLVVNARDAMPKGGTLNLETDLADGREIVAASSDLPREPVVCLRVRDNGSGMSEEVKSHIFEPFYTTKEKGKGTGLGLSTVFGIIKQSNGQVSVESEPGKGTTFSVYLPLLKEAVPDIGISKPKAVAGNNTETVLLVEDDEMLRRLSERLLKGGGYTVITASNGKNALEVMERRGKPVDLLLSDVVMPGMSGRDLARQLESRRLICRTLYMSGYTDDAMVKHGVLDPGIAFIYKPFSAEALAEKLREVLDGPADQAKA